MSVDGSSRSRGRSLTDLAVILVIAVIGMLLTLQGWKSRAPAFDMLTYFNSAEALLAHGTPARYGDVSSYGSFSAPGTAWLLAPGMFLFSDPRLYEKLGSALLHVGTLFGVFLVARQALGRRSACIAVALYGLSGLGLSFAGSLWPIGQPFFYVWMGYFAIRWVVRRDARYVALAVATWAAGMYVDMAITPAAFVLPALWLLYRPPLFTRLHLIVAVFIVALWYPYLRFELDRGFADLRSQFFLHNIMPSNYRDAWCDRDLALKHAADPSAPTPTEATPTDSKTVQKVRSDGLHLVDRLVRRGRRLGDGLRASFEEATPSPAMSLLLTLVAVGSVGLLSLRALRGRGSSLEAQVFVLTLLVPWLLLLVVAEPGRPERFFWLWPLQAIGLAAAFSTVIVPERVGSAVVWVAGLLLVVGVLVNPLQTHLGPWIREGWSGSDPEEVRVVDYVASQLRAEGKDRAAIGYQLFIYDFMPKYNIVDPQYKVGAEFDLLFKYRHGIRNTDVCAEGVSTADEYRIVQARPKSGEAEPRAYFDVPVDSRLRQLRDFDLYRVFKRI